MLFLPEIYANFYTLAGSFGADFNRGSAVLGLALVKVQGVSPAGSV